MNEWSVIVKDRYPAYVSRDTFEQIQATLRDNHAEYDRNKTRGVPRDGAALLPDDEIARLLTESGFRSPHHDVLLPSTVRSIRLKHRRLHRYRAPRPRRVDGFLTVPQVAQALGVTTHWLYNLMSRGVIEIDRDADTRLYLFPDRPETINELKRLQGGAISRMRF